MDSGIIVYLPVSIISLISLAFLILWHLRIATSWQWSAGFALTATGFGFSAFPIAPAFDAFVSGFIFIGAAYFYSSAVLLHFDAPMRRWERRLFAFTYVPFNGYTVFISANLNDQLLVTDVAFAILLGSALLMAIPRASRPADKIMIVAGWIVTIDTLARTTFFYFFTESSDQLADFVNSDYNLFVHITTITICMLFPFSALGAMASAAIDKHRDAAGRDALTGLLNRRGLNEVVEMLTKNNALNGSILICDIDHFKQINDKYGHAVGDKVIVALAKELQNATGSHGYAARLGGEEFVAYFPGTSQEDATRLAQLLRVAFSGRAWRLDGVLSEVTASFGVSAIRDGEITLHPAIDRADKALYSAKASGRNKVVVSPAEDFSYSAAGNLFEQSFASLGAKGKFLRSH
ncbi:diguanylate cyclase [Hoeflea sp. Naph1]|uniref:GGDEF domain-containing protein n=1 Tax=Hoeflea sp. Naph1 TaxID=3388653 RepID=UPI003990341A